VKQCAKCGRGEDNLTRRGLTLGSAGVCSDCDKGVVKAVKKPEPKPEPVEEVTAEDFIDSLEEE